MQAAGEGLADVRSQVSAAAASATAAAKGVAHRDDKPAERGPSGPRPGRPRSGASRASDRPARGGRDRSEKRPVAARRRFSPGPGRTAGYTQRMAEIGTLRVKTGLAEMLKGGVIMDSSTPTRPASRRTPARAR